MKFLNKRLSEYSLGDVVLAILFFQICGYAAKMIDYVYLAVVG